MLRADPLGSSYSLTGFQAFCSINNNNVAAGNVRVTDAPLLTEPASLDTIVPTWTAATGSVAFTPTPLGAAERAFVFASPMRSAGRGFEADYRLILVTTAAGASPANIFATWTARFGTPIVGARIFVAIARYSLGFISPSLNTSSLVTA
jgi:hypothetical protein